MEAMKPALPVLPPRRAPLRPPPEGVVSVVEPGSWGEAAGLRRGDRVLAVNGRPVRDVIDWRFYTAADDVALTVRRGEQMLDVSVAKPYDADLGVEFEEALFGGLRRCNNRCNFCFVDRLPPNVRQTLLIKDDDYRYSFLNGDFITLTNLRESDWQRIEEQGLSPLYVSVHATDDAVRRVMLGHPKAAPIMEQLRRLFSIGVQVHTQVVICPGFNDGAQLERTVRDLAGCWPHVQSLALVPVGLAEGHGTISKQFMPGLRPMTVDECRETLARTRAWQAEFRRALGRRFVYASDELILLAGQPVPGAQVYDGFPMLENGVGITRLLIDDWHRLRRRLPPRLERPVRALAVCGELIAPVLAPMIAGLAQVEGCDLGLQVVRNRFFGERITASGLLAGRDVVEALRPLPRARYLFLTRRALDYSTGSLFLDGASVAEVESALGCQVVPVLSTSDMWQHLRKG